MKMEERDRLEAEREEVERTLELNGAHPDWTDLQVAEELLSQETPYGGKVRTMVYTKNLSKKEKVP